MNYFMACKLHRTSLKLPLTPFPRFGLLAMQLLLCLMIALPVHVFLKVPREEQAASGGCGRGVGAS